MRMEKYDIKIMVFSLNCHLFKMEYVFEVVQKGSKIVGVQGTDNIVLVIKTKSTTKLENSRIIKKIINLDNHIILDCVRLKIGPHVLINKAQTDYQNHRRIIDVSLL